MRRRCNGCMRVPCNWTFCSGVSRHLAFQERVMFPLGSGAEVCDAAFGPPLEEPHSRILRYSASNGRTGKPRDYHQEPNLKSWKTFPFPQTTLLVHSASIPHVRNPSLVSESFEPIQPIPGVGHRYLPTILHDHLAAISLRTFAPYCR